MLRISLLEMTSSLKYDLLNGSSRRSAHVMLTWRTKHGERPSGTRYGMQNPLAGKVRRKQRVCVVAPAPPP